MELGYGSEFQLMRFLGHHREELDKLIQEASGRSEQVYWFDFPYDENRLSGDGECKGIECFKELDNYDTIKKKWVEFWPQRGTAMNWDGIFKIGDTWFFVEAKAHKEESFQWCSAEAEESRETINTAFSKTQQWLKADTSKDWIITNCYQLANRLAFMYFCHQCGIEAKLLYIGFINGYRQKKDEIHSVEEWVPAGCSPRRRRSARHGHGRPTCSRRFSTRGVRTSRNRCPRARQW